MKTLRTLAKGHQCYLRLPGICNFDSATTVLAHIRRGGLGGIGLKPADIAAAPLCSRCHDVFDGRVQTQYSRQELDAEMLRALASWLNWLWSQELLVLVA